MPGFDWKGFAKSTLAKRAKAKAKAKKKSTSSGGQKSNAWRAYVSGSKKR